MEKAKVDYIVAHYIGNIYMFYKKDIDKAIFYYEQAAKFSEPYSTRHRVIAPTYQALAYYLADTDHKEKDWEMAAGCVEQAKNLSLDNLELDYLFAQYSALSGQTTQACETIARLIRADPKYIVKIISEPDFTLINDQMSEIFCEYEHELSTSFMTLFRNMEGKISAAPEWWERALLYGVELTFPDGAFDGNAGRAEHVNVFPTLAGVIASSIWYALATGRWTGLRR